MRRRLAYPKNANNDLEAARRWLTQPGSGPAARRRLAAIKAQISALRKHPCLYPAGAYPGVREMTCAGGYRVIYVVVPDTGRNQTAGDIWIVRIFGPGQCRDVL